MWSLCGHNQRRLGSWPINYALVLPWMTPSTLTIGMILKIKLFSRVLASSVPEIRKLIIPYNIKPDVISPGCCLARIHTDFFDLFINSVLVTSNKSTSFDPKVNPTFFILITLCNDLSLSRVFKNWLKSLSV